MEKFVVSDTSPLIGLAHLGLLTIPKMLWGKLYVPTAVFAEVLRKSPGREEVQRAVSDGWIVVKKVNDMATVKILNEVFGPGESECFVLVRELKAHLLVMDEKRGRKAAKRFGFRLTGTVGILTTAVEKGLLPAEDMPALLKKLKDCGFRLSNDLVRQFAGS